MKTEIEFVYFDLGNVLVSFDPHRACRNVAQLLNVNADEVDDAIYKSGLQDQYEHGLLDGDSYVAQVRDRFGLGIDALPVEPFLTAISDMFEPIDSMIEVVDAVRKSCRVGILSNTCLAHWQWVTGKSWEVMNGHFDARILSYEIGAMKPDTAIYEAAERIAVVDSEKLLFIDDRPENVAAAIARGWNAVQCFGGDEARGVFAEFGLLG